MARTITWDELKELNKWARDVTGSHDDEWGFAECLYPVRDRLYLRPEGEPDTADLADQVAEINTICDGQHIAKLEGKPAKRVAVMAEMLKELRDSRMQANGIINSVRATCREHGCSMVGGMATEAAVAWLGVQLTEARAERDALSAKVAELEAELGQLDAKPAKKPKPKCKVRKSGGVTLRMTSDEAMTLRQIVANVGGDPVLSARKYSDAIRDALETAGVTKAGHRLERDADELRFKDFA